MIKYSLGAAIIVAMGVTTTFGQVDLKGAAEKAPAAVEKAVNGAKPGVPAVPGGVPGAGGAKPTVPPAVSGAKPPMPIPGAPKVEAPKVEVPAAGAAKPVNPAGAKPDSAKPLGGAWGGKSNPLDQARGTVDATGKSVPPNLGKDGKDAAAGAINRTPVGERNKDGANPAAGTDVKANGFAEIKNSYRDRNTYSQDWYRSHPQAWLPPRLSTGTVWAATPYAAVVAYLGYNNVTPVSYGYGNNVIYQNGVILIDGRNAGTAAEFSQQAAILAARGSNIPTAENDEWLPLGVFGLVRDESQRPQATLQLVVSRQGFVRGNYQDAVTDMVLPIQGAIQQETQRAAWTIGDRADFLMEAGLVNLAGGDAPALIHKNGETTQWWLVRLNQPNQ